MVTRLVMCLHLVQVYARVGTMNGTTTCFTEWFGPAEGIVVLDRNGDGTIQGQDLFGDEQVTGRNVANGYEDLALLDSNNDGTFDFRDERFHEVQIWQDANSDGIAQEGEMSSLFQNGISSLDLQATAGAVAGENSAVIREGSEFRALMERSSAENNSRIISPLLRTNLTLLVTMLSCECGSAEYASEATANSADDEQHLEVTS